MKSSTLPQLLISFSLFSTLVAADPPVHPFDDWTYRVIPGLQSDHLQSVAYGNGRFVAVGGKAADATDSSDLVRYSDGGKDWQTAAVGGTGTGLISVAFGNGIFVAIGATAIRSVDGIHWDSVPLPVDFTPASIAFLNNEFIIQAAEGFKAEILRSNSGATWQRQTLAISGPPSFINPVTMAWKLGYANGIYVAVGSYGSIRTSPDLVTWSIRTVNWVSSWIVQIDHRPNLTDVTFGNGLFMAVGPFGAVITSPDAINWTAHLWFGAATFFHIPYSPSTLTFIDGNFLIATDSGILRTTDGVMGNSWYFNDSTTAAVAGRGSVVAVSDDGGAIFQAGPGIEGFDPAWIAGGGSDFNLTVQGSSFLEGAKVQWNGTERPTTFVNDTTLVARIAAADIPAVSDLTSAAVTVVNPDGVVSLPKPFIVTSPNVSGVQSKFAGSGETAIVSTVPTEAAGTAAGIEAWLYNSGLPEPVTITTATYSANPAPSSAFDVAGNFLDLKVTGADPADQLQADFYYPVAVAESETTPTLKFYDGNAWVTVCTSGGLPPIKNTLNNLDGTISGGRFEVVFDQSSTPKITELGGTIFGVALEPLTFTGFLAPIDGGDGSGGSFAHPLRTFKAGSTIPIKFKTSRNGASVVTGVHHLQVVKYSNATTAAAPIDATTQEAVTSGNQFVLKGTEWHFNLDTKGTGLTNGIWQVAATLSGGSQHYVWIQIK